MVRNTVVCMLDATFGVWLSSQLNRCNLYIQGHFYKQIFKKKYKEIKIYKYKYIRNTIKIL